MRVIRLASLALLLSAAVTHAETIGVAMAGLDNFQTALLNSVTARAQSIPGVKLVVKNAAGNTDLQKSQVQDLVSQKVDALIVMVADGDLGPTLTKTAGTAGLPLVYLNNVPSNSDDLPADEVIVASDEKESGTMQAKQVCKLLNGQGRVVVLMGELISPAARNRTQDVSDVIASPDCKGIKIVERQAANWSRDFADQQVQEWQQAGVKFDAVVANNDEMALGAIRALKRANVSTAQVIVAGVDATNDALQAMQAGDLRVTVLQNAVGQGSGAVDAAISLIKKQAVPRVNYVPFELVTSENLAKYLPKSQ